MCSFLFSTKKSNCDIDELNFYLKFRGPDHTTKNTINGHTFIHNLLSLTGKFTKQPFVSDKIIALYNGEVYNHTTFGSYDSDGECIIPLYKKHGSDFIKKLDGEFAICLVDYGKNILIASSDIFKTKPIFLGMDKQHLAVSTYKTPIEKLNLPIVSLDANTTYTICLKTKKILKKEHIYEFDLNQHKNTYEDWIFSFKDAVKKRIFGIKDKLFMGLSSGYDSGIIYNELLQNDVNFDSYSLIGTENESIIDDRIALKNNKCQTFKFKKNNADYILSNLIIKRNTEKFNYTINKTSNDHGILLTDDSGSNNFATICRKAKQNNKKICISGCGADEIISDYGFNGKKHFPHSNFGGLFPKDLKEIFPWNSFYKSTMESYIAKEEYVGGSLGMEMRYPFLDKSVVQEFLWLHQDLKNKNYKAPIDYYFTKYNFPYEKEIKRGF